MFIFIKLQPFLKQYDFSLLKHFLTTLFTHGFISFSFLLPLILHPILKRLRLNFLPLTFTFTFDLSNHLHMRPVYYLCFYSGPLHLYYQSNQAHRK